MKIVFSIIATLAAVFISFANSIESPPMVGESYAIKYVGLLNLVWFIPYLIYYGEKRNNKEIANCLIIFVVAYLPFLYMRYYTVSFNEKNWKTELDYQKISGKYPAHANGNMVEDIISSRMLIGLSKEQVESKLGKNYYVTLKNGVVENMVYSYTHSNIFDGCDKLFVTFNEGVCIEADYGGCD